MGGGPEKGATAPVMDHRGHVRPEQILPDETFDAHEVVQGTELGGVEVRSDGDQYVDRLTADPG